jgi:SAM-dependent methyltransferase
MERSGFTSRANHNAVGAAIHLARYLLAAPYCQGKHVLDVACGEGYGCQALKRHGAATVDGVDNAPQAIETARALFSGAGINYHVHDAERIDELFPEGHFDLVLSLETIEHVRDPARFLRAVKTVAKRDGVIIISCANDAWYHRADGDANSFQRRPSSFEAFRALTTGVLGDGALWGCGAPVIGFGNFADGLQGERDDKTGLASTPAFVRQAAAITLPPRAFTDIGCRNCAYFIGVWGGIGARIWSSAVAPITMDQYASVGFWQALDTPRAARQEPAHADGVRMQDLADKNSTLLLSLSNLERKNAEITDELVEERKSKEHYRVQAVALMKEVEILSERVRILAHGRGLPSSENRNSSQERAFAALARQVRPFLKLRDRLIASLLTAARWVKPWLPARLLRVAQWAARRLGL